MFTKLIHNLPENKFVDKHMYECVTTGNGYWVRSAAGVRTQVITQAGKLIESAGIEIANNDAFLDTSGNEVLQFGVVGTAVNHLKITNAATGNNAILEAVGGDANVGLNFLAKGTGAFSFQNTDAGATGVVVGFYHNSASPAASDVVTRLLFQGEDSAGNTQDYGKIDAVIRDATSTTEDGDLLFYTMKAGTLTLNLQLDSDVAGILVGDGAASAVVTSNGAFDLVLNTNSGTASSNITITDAANGNVTVNLNGTGIAEVASTDAGALGAVLKLSHASASPANSDVVGRVLFSGLDNAAAAEDYGRIDVVVTDVTAANPDSNMQFFRDIAGTLTEVLKLDTDVTVTPGATGNVIVAGARGVASSVATFLAPFYCNAAQDNIAEGAGGAISVATPFTTIGADAGGDAFTLASGQVIGQIKKIYFKSTSGGTGVVTGAFRGTNNTLTFTNAGEYAIFQWDGTDWLDIELASGLSATQAPVLSTV